MINKYRLRDSVKMILLDSEDLKKIVPSVLMGGSRAP